MSLDIRFRSALSGCLSLTLSSRGKGRRTLPADRESLFFLLRQLPFPSGCLA